MNIVPYFSQKTHRFLFYWLPLIIWITGIFLVSSLPSSSLPQSKVFSHYSQHFIAFFILFLLFHRLFRSNGKAVPISFLLSFIFTITVSFFKECWQILIPTRSFGLKDVLFDSIAAFLAMLVVGVNGTARNLKFKEEAESSKVKGESKRQEVRGER